ncbi:hypothetical protein OKW30_003698 [Paraburkholderia sp. Clong3]
MVTEVFAGGRFGTVSETALGRFPVGVHRWPLMSRSVFPDYLSQQTPSVIIK